MNPVTVVVVHREAMVAEGLAAALARFPGLHPLQWPQRRSTANVAEQKWERLRSMNA